MEKVTIYVAGNPNAYPVEYYSRETGSFQGIIPELLQRFSQQSIYNIVYYSASREDQRERLALNRQVDIVSGLDGTENIRHRAGTDIVLLDTIQKGEPVTYRLSLIDVAPESLRGELEDFLAGVSAETRTGLLIEAAQRTSLPRQSRLEAAVWGISLAAAILAAALLLQFLRRRRRIRALQKKSETDPATGIGTMEYLTRRSQDMLNAGNRVLYQMLYVHLDHKYLERMTSPEELTAFFRSAAAILQDYVKDTDVLARVSGQGFVLLRQSVGEQDSLGWIPEALSRIRAASSERGGSGVCGAAAGVYPLKADGAELDEMVFRSFQSARAAYQKGEDYQICTEEVLRNMANEKRLQEDIRRGLENREFQIYIQLYVNAKSGRIVGGEALPCWEHPERGLLPPEHFMPLMEREGLTGQLDYHTLERACGFLEGLCQKGIQDFFISFRFSREAASLDGFIPRCRELVAAYQTPKGLLFLGFTERALAAISPQAREELRDIGIQAVLEDPGGADLYTIRRCQLDGLKTGGHLMESPDTRSMCAVLGGMVRMGHGLGVPVLAGGVDTEEQAGLLRDLACDAVRGNLYYHPLPLWEVRKKVLEQWSVKEGLGT